MNPLKLSAVLILYIKKIINIQVFMIILLIFSCLTTPATGLSQEKFVAVSCGFSHTVALREDDTVWTWGKTYIGPSNTSEYGKSIVQVPISDVVAISAGLDYTLALKKDGTVWAWGNNDCEQLGDGTNETRDTPVQVHGLDNVIAISTSFHNSLALKSDGTVWAWGTNTIGNLGDGTFEIRYTPVQLKDLSNIKSIFSGAFAIKDDGTVWTWGITLLEPDSNGQINAYDIPSQKAVSKLTPYQVPELSGVTAIDTDNGYLHTLFIKNDGTVWAWGSNCYGELADGSTEESKLNYINVPLQVSGLTNIKAISVGAGNSMALGTNGNVWIWGKNTHEKFGIGSGGSEYVIFPKQVPGLDNVIAIDSSYLHSAFLKSDGSIWMSGENGDGQLGLLNSSAEIDRPVYIIGPTSAADTSTPASNVSAQSVIIPILASSQDNMSLIAIVIGLVIAIILIASIIYLYIFRKKV